MGISEIVKTKKLYGTNAPVMGVGVSGLPGGIDSVVTTMITQGTASFEPTAMSRWIEATSNGYMCCYLNTSKELVTGYCSDLDFLTVDDAVESEITQPAIATTTSQANGLDVARLSDDTALLVILDFPTSNQSTLKCYKSSDGDGGNWAWLSNIDISTAFSGYIFKDSDECHMTVDDDGNVFVIANILKPYSGDNAQSHTVVFKSEDKGATWSEVMNAGGGLTATRGCGQVAFMPDRYWCTSTRVNYVTLYVSTDDGDTWSTVGNINSGTFDSLTSSQVQGAAFYYQASAYSALAHITYPFAVGENGGLFEIYKPSFSDLNDLTNFERQSSVGNLGTARSARIYTLGDNLVIQPIYDGKPHIYTAKIAPGPLENVKSITVTQSIGQSGACTIEVDNKDGVYSYDGSENYQSIGPNKDVTVQLGYGPFLEKVFSGIIDRVTVKNPPASMTIVSRDNCKLALDGIVIRPTDGFRTFSFTSTTPEAIFTSLAGWAGYTDINTDTTGITVALITFDWETYADAFGRLCDLCAFDWWVDVDGAIYFRMRASNEPRATDEAHTLVLEGSDYVCTLSNTPIVSTSDVLTDSTGVTTYVRDTDYSIDLSTGKVTSLAGGALASGGDIKASYTYPRHTFKEGEDIVSYAYTVDDAELYYKTVAYGTDSNGNDIKATHTLSSRIFNVQENKHLPLRIPGAVTSAQLQNIADAAGGALRYRARYADVTAIAVPTVKIGDCVQIIESTSGTSEVYRVTELSYTYSDKGKPLMTFRAYYAGYAPIGGS